MPASTSDCHMQVPRRLDLGQIFVEEGPPGQHLVKLLFDDIKGNSRVGVRGYSEPCASRDHYSLKGWPMEAPDWHSSGVSDSLKCCVARLAATQVLAAPPLSGLCRLRAGLRTAATGNYHLRCGTIAPIQSGACSGFSG